MDNDVDMDAPQISTLHDEATPPPSRGSKLKVKLLVGDKKTTAKSPGVPTAARKSVPQIQNPPQPASEEEVDEEDEEDQLIDDDEPAPPISAPVASVSAGTKRKAPPKKPSRPRKSDRQDKEDKKPDEPREPPDNEEHPLDPPALPDKPSPKKKPAPRKTAASSKPKIKVPPKGPKNPANPPAEEAVMSESEPPPPSWYPDASSTSLAHTITAPSSPLPVSRIPSPEPEEAEPIPPPVPERPEQTGPAEGLPLPMPVYPLPSKPFPVQPPPKIGTGFAPVQPLDRSGTKVRRWRIANREIRGIAGGRWFARSWVGDKESEFATVGPNTKAADSDKIAIPKSVASISAPALGKSGKSKAAARASAAISAAPSRSGSTVPDPHTIKAPSKMRNIIASEAGDEPEIVVRDSISMVS